MSGGRLHVDATVVEADDQGLARFNLIHAAQDFSRRAFQHRKTSRQPATRGQGGEQLQALFEVVASSLQKDPGMVLVPLLLAVFQLLALP